MVLPQTKCISSYFPCRDSYSEHFHELYFMPDIPELIEVNSVLKEHREDPSSQPDLKTQLRQSMKGVTHESLDVRLHALSKLRDLLHRNQVRAEKICNSPIPQSQLVNTVREGFLDILGLGPPGLHFMESGRH